MGETKEIERSVQMRLYALHKRQFVAVFASFFICLFITILIGIAGPSVIQSNNYIKPENPPISLSGPYKFETGYLDKFHQRLWLTMKTTTDSNDEFRQPVNVSISVGIPPSTDTKTYDRLRTIHCQKQVSNKR